MTLISKPTPQFAYLEGLTPAMKARVEAAAIEANDRYVIEFLEEFGYCPFAETGRKKGETGRHVFFMEEGSIDGLATLMMDIANDPSQVVAQVIMPLLEVEPQAFRKFCLEMTDYAHSLMPGKKTLACAPLHPTLSYDRERDAGMVPLFRRSPDPTIQWVRLDALEALYRGRHRNTVFMTPDEIREMLAGPPRKEKEPLYDRICRTNGLMARRMGLDAVEETLRGYARDAHSAYAQIIIEELEAV